jgi:hypothetical protein
MIGAMAVLLLTVGAFVVFRDVNRDDPPSPVKAVDYRGEADYARDAATFDLLAPRKLPEGWIATSVTFTQVEEQAWHLGCLTDERHYVGLEQADRPVSSMVEDFVDQDAVQGDDVEVAGETWETWSDDGGDLALVSDSSGVTTVVVGRVPEETLAEFITTLH